MMITPPKDLPRYRRILLIWLGLTAIEGLVAFGFSLQEPSMSRNALLWGYSASRLLISALILLAALGVISLAVYVSLCHRLVEKVQAALQQGLLAQKKLVAASIGILAPAVTLIVLILFIGLSTPLDEETRLALLGPTNIYLFSSRLLPPLVWAALALLQMLACWFVLYGAIPSTRRSGRRRPLARHCSVAWWVA